MLGRCKPVATRIKVLLARNSRLAQDPERRPQDRLVRDRPGDVADQDAGVFAALCQLPQRLAADRFLELGCNSRIGIIQRRNLLDRQRTDHAICGQLHGQARSTVIECYFQCLHRGWRSFENVRLTYLSDVRLKA